MWIWLDRFLINYEMPNLCANVNHLRFMSASDHKPPYLKKKKIDKLCKRSSTMDQRRVGSVTKEIKE